MVAQQSLLAWAYAVLDRTINEPVAFFTLALVVSTTLLWRATLRLAKEARESATEQADKMERSIEAANNTATAAARSAEEAARAAKAAIDQNRAWLKIDDLSISEVKWKEATNRPGEPEYLSATLTATVKNVGATPATNISYEVRIWAFPMMANYSEWYEIWERAAAAHKERVKDSVEGWVLFPGDTSKQSNGTHTSWNGIEGEIALDSNSPELIRLMGIATAVYRIASGDIAYTSVPFLFDRRGEADPWTGKSLMDAGDWLNDDVYLVRVHHGDRAT